MRPYPSHSDDPIEPLTDCGLLSGLQCKNELSPRPSFARSEVVMLSGLVLGLGLGLSFRSLSLRSLRPERKCPMFTKRRLFPLEP